MRIFGFTSYGGPEVTGLLDVPDPVPGPGEVLVETRASGVNPADVKVRQGARAGTIEVRFPMAMGREAAGVVLALGADVAGVVPGDPVFGATSAGTGGLAERVLLDAASLARVPAGLDWGQAACIPVSAGTAHDALDQLALPIGSVLLVTGAGGGVGTSLLQLARARGLRVVGVASAGKRGTVERLGGEHVTSGEGWADRVRELAPTGADGLLDMVGGDVLRAAAGLLVEGGTPLSIADPGLAGELGGRGVTRRRTTQAFAEVAALAADGVLDIPVTAVIPLSRAGEAVALVEQGHATGKVVVVPDDQLDG
ncbi:MAG: NADP-dependent oxidoreductase [Nocardioidaceae bacterium]